MATRILPRAAHPAAPARIAVDGPLLAIFGLALALRLAMAPFAGLYHPDELFQYLEQAHRLVFGQGVVPWEYRYGMRSWLLPLTVAVPMALGDRIAPDSLAYLLLPRALAACLSLTIVWTAWSFGARIGRRHGLIAAVIAAIWGEFIFLAPHILSETASIALILPAAALITRRSSARLYVLAGAMLGLGVILRLQHAPAVAILLVLMLRRRAMWKAFVIGMAAAALASVTIDLAMRQPPFGWAIEYVRQNLLHDRAAIYGTSPPTAYLSGIAGALGGWALPMLTMAAIGARRQPALCAAALVNLGLHMAIDHKEYRFILLTQAILLLLAAIGTGDLVAVAARRWPERARLATAMALLLWTGASASLAASGRVGTYRDFDARGPDLYTSLHDDPGLCGLATLATPFSKGGGYAYLHRAVPIYAYRPDEAAMLLRDATGFNRIIAPAASPVPPGFVLGKCAASAAGDPPLCLFIRPGRCAAIRSVFEINRMLVRTDQ
ncbi:hypothetical protein FHS31_000022 [Sphingomonas vulcanisoli]|uniref:4-amino-4-deoxy-L-arabinose transferase n=1 Tax=Sphingomonas vulcanisoli TaxID=1658060 RepID=A0ABX0TP89_9SPHN|nr:4-amino-4-deoxy-L-arabinose transferase [Sphingomonas vulcanisoli]NIJ06440.1 hypothetical protein [Sphingomonas vulcanisoli]